MVGLIWEGIYVEADIMRQLWTGRYGKAGMGRHIWGPIWKVVFELCVSL